MWAQRFHWEKLYIYIYINIYAAAAKSLQSCPTLRDPIDGSPPGSPVPGILQARTLEWVAISFSFLMVDIHREGHSQRSAPQKRHTAHLRRSAHCTPRKPSDLDRRGDKTHCPPGGDCACQAPGHLNARTWEGHKTQAQPSLRLWGVPENLNMSGLDLGSARNPGPASDSSPAEQPGA